MTDKGQPYKRVRRGSFNLEEANNLWLPVWILNGKVNDSETIKRAFKSAKKYHQFKTVAADFGINLDIFIEKLEVNKNDNNKTQHIEGR